MAFDDVYAVTDRLQPSTADQIAATEAALGIELPPDYAGFVTRFGGGMISNWVRVYSPEQVAEEHPEHRARCDEYYFWHEGADVLTKEQVSSSVMLADTFNGDEVLYHPHDPVGLFVLPRDEEVICPVGDTLAEAINWLCSSGTLTAPLSFLAFEPFGGRQQRRYESSANGPSFESVRDALLALGLHDQLGDGTEGDDKCFDFYVRELGGGVTIVEGHQGAVALLLTDSGATGPKLDRVIATLTTLGLCVQSQ